MSKFIKVGDRLINTDTIAEVTDSEVVMKSGDVIRTKTYDFFDTLQNDGKFIPSTVTTYVVQPFELTDVDGKVDLEEYPVIGWRITDSYSSSSEAVPVFHGNPGEFDAGNTNFWRCNAYPLFPLAIRFEGSESIWVNGWDLSREKFISYCEDHLARAKAYEEKKNQQQEK